MSYNIPILFLIFNRPDTTHKVFESIKAIKPFKLYVAADGWREGYIGEDKLCKTARAIIKNGIDWDCELYILFREENLGCGIAISQAINWFFEHEEMGIILEDDTLPNHSFFEYCEKMLMYYKDDSTVMHVSGNNFANTNKLKSSYYFTKLPFIWGWATWRRAWLKYDFFDKFMSNNDKQLIIDNAFTDIEIRAYWKDIFQSYNLTHKSYTWDYQWFLAIWKNDSKVIQPKYNLVKNIGFTFDATHTIDTSSKLGKLKTYKLQVDNFIVNTEINIGLQNQNFNFYFQMLENKFNPILISKKIIIFFTNLIKSKCLKVLKKIHNRLSLESILSNTIVSSKAVIGKKCFLGDCFVGDFTYISENAVISKTNIGKFCSIGPNVTCGRGIHPLHGLSTSPMFYSTKKQNGYSLSQENKISERLPIFIGNDVFIGANVTILDGISIADGAVVAAGAVVVKNVKEYEVVGGVPARHIKYRFSHEIIKKLINISWWNWPEEKLHEVEKLFFDIEQFIDKYNKNT